MIKYFKRRKAKKLLKKARELKANIEMMGMYRPAHVNASDWDYYERMVADANELLGINNSENKIS